MRRDCQARARVEPESEPRQLRVTGSRSRTGRPAATKKQERLLEAVVERDPMFGPAFNNLIQAYLRTRDFDLGNALVGRVERIVGETDDVNQSWGMIAVAQGDSARAIRVLRKSYELNPLNTVNQVWYSFALESIGEFETMIEIGVPLRIAARLRPFRAI